MKLQVSDLKLLKPESYKDPNEVRTTCPICGSRAIIEKYDSFRKDGSFRMVVCRCQNHKRLGRGKDKICGRMTTLQETPLVITDIKPGVNTKFEEVKKSMKNTKNHLTEEQKNSIMDEIRSGLSMNKIAKKYNISPGTVHFYKNKIKETESQTKDTIEESEPVSAASDVDFQINSNLDITEDPEDNDDIPSISRQTKLQIDSQQLAKELFDKAIMDAYYRGFDEGRKDATEKVKSALQILETSAA